MIDTTIYIASAPGDGYIATVGDERRYFESFADAVKWVEERMEEEDEQFGKTEQLPVVQPNYKKGKGCYRH